MKPLAPNTLLQNRYLVVHLIGKGGMGDVYLAVDQRLGSAVALKRTFHGDDPQLGDAFEREARTLARLRHPALPKVSDHFLENGNQFLVMEHISGDDLASRLKATAKPFPLSWVLYWADQLLDALAYLHSHEPPIIHRDIKPQNLKLTDENNIVLLDFGLSKSSPMASTTSGASGSSGSTGSVVGYTPHYAPMEQIRGTGTNPRSDIYSLSATLYQLLANVVPPDALTRADFMLGGKNDPIVAISEINGEIPREISDVILKGMSVSQDQRFVDAREMQKVLRETYARLQQAPAGASTASSGATFGDQPAASTPSNPAPAAAVPVQNQPSDADAMGAATIPFGMMDPLPSATPAAQTPSTPTPAAEPEPAADFNATLKMDEAFEPAQFASPSQPEPLQSGIKTEVFIPGSALGLTPDAAAPVAETPSTGTGFTGDQTVPLIGYEQAQASIGADSADSGPAPTAYAIPIDFSQTPGVGQQPPPPPESEEATPAFEDPSPSFAEEPAAPAAAAAAAASVASAAAAKSAPKQKTQAPAKKKTGMLVGVLAGLVGLGVLAVAAVVGVWYFMNQSPGGEAPVISNSSTPQPTPDLSPTPLATPEPTPSETNVNTAANGSTESGNANTPANAGSGGSQSTPTPESSRAPQSGPTPAKSGPTPRQPSQQPQQPTGPQTNPKPPASKPPVKSGPTPRGGLIPQ